MKILLINTQLPYFLHWTDYYIPSSLLYLAGALQKNGDNVNILDLNTFKINNNDDEDTIDTYKKIIIDRISDIHPSIIGITSLFSGQFRFVSTYSSKIKEKFGNIPIVIGGIHPTTFPYEILSNHPYIDYIIIGEGDESIIHLVNVIKSKFDKYLNKNVNQNDENHDELKKIDGLAYRYNGNVLINPKTKFISDLDKIPFPAYDAIDIKDYYYDTTNWHNPKNLPINCSVPIISTRGCPNRCNFCSIFLSVGHRYRKRSPKKVVDEIEFVYNKYNHRHFSFMDDNLTFDKSHILDICNEIIKRDLNIQFEVPSGLSVNTIDNDILDALVSAGLVRIPLAIESGSDYIRNDIMGKKLSRDKIFEVVRLTKKYRSLYVKAFFIMGMPEETRNTLWDTYDMIKEIDVDKPIVSNIHPFYGTRLFEQVLRDNLLIESFDPDDIRKTEDFYFTDNKRFFIKPYNLEMEDLYEFRGRYDKLIEELMTKKIKKGYYDIK